MEIQINSRPDQGQTKSIPPRKARQKLLDSFIVRVVICCLVIDAALFVYFRIFKGIPVFEGLMGWQKSLHKMSGIETNQNPIIRRKTIYVKQQPIPESERIKTNKKNEHENKKKHLYKWIDDNGGIHFSNSTYPNDGRYIEVRNEINPFGKETKFIYRPGGTILIPVIVRSNGRKEKINLVLDTGCHITQIHPDVLQRLNVKTTKKGKTIIADGRRIDRFLGKVDSFEVGPFREQNFIIMTNTIEQSTGYDGLLGMNYLKKHPFEIDHQKQVIRWQ